MEDLPPEILEKHISQHLKNKELLAFSLTNKKSKKQSEKIMKKRESQEREEYIKNIIENIADAHYYPNWTDLPIYKELSNKLFDVYTKGMKLPSIRRIVLDPKYKSFSSELLKLQIDITNELEKPEYIKYMATFIPTNKLKKDAYPFKN